VLCKAAISYQYCIASVKDDEYGALVER